MQPPVILFKFPTRSRPERFFRSLDSIYDNLSDLDNFQVQVTADIDDKSMTDVAVKDRIESYPNCHVLYGTSESKVAAINRDMELFDGTWQICCVMSDDMLFTFYGFDSILREAFSDGNFDKLVHFPDNDAKNILAVLYIAGVDFYKRFNYIYNPIYSSLFCDDEIQAIAKALGKYSYENVPGLFFHANPAYGHQPKDSMFIEQQEIGWSLDQETFFKRKSQNFGL